MQGGTFHIEFVGAPFLWKIKLKMFSATTATGTNIKAPQAVVQGARRSPTAANK
jgi:hypothetical protein